MEEVMANATQVVGTGTTEYSIWRVIMASSVGTMIEWYDFYIFGSLAAILQSASWFGLSERSSLAASVTSSGENMPSSSLFPLWAFPPSPSD
jgi:hypothetical protein